MDQSPAHDSGEVLEAATASLGNSPYPVVRRVSCEFDEGVLILRGRVYCYYHMQLAQEAVLRVDSVAPVVNEIEVVDLLR